MSTIYKHLINNDIQSGKNTGVLLETEKTRELRLRGIKITVFILFVFTAAAFGGALMIYQKWGSEKSLNKKMEAERIQLQDKIASFDSETKNLTDEMDALRQKLDLGKRENDRLKQRLAEQSDELSVSQTQISGLQAEKNTLKETIRTLEDKLSAASPVMKNYADAAPQAPAPTTAAFTGKQSRILSINRRFNFVVINLGFDDRLRIGDQLAVDRDGQDIGMVKVEKAYDHFSAATIIKEGRGIPFQEGDSVRRL